MDSRKDKIVLPGDLIGENLTSGHGTYQLEGLIYASVAGVTHLEGNVIWVKPLKRRYKPSSGEIVVGRVVNVDNKRWMVDINSYQHAILNLAATTLPGGE